VTRTFPPCFSKGGSQSVTHYEKELVIEFAEPVANLEWQIWGARTVTDNRGYTVHMNPTLWPGGPPAQAVTAKFPGSGITRITISDPIIYDVYYPNGTLDVPGFWEITSWNVDWTLGSTYDQCNCGRPQISAPPTQNISTGWPFDLSGVDPNWSMLIQVTANDGLVVRDVKLGQRYLAERISVPYFALETSAMQRTRGELRPGGSEPSMRSRLVKFNVSSDNERLVIEASYVIDRIPAGSASCLEITQRYEFYRTKAGDNCEPSASLPCARWRPIVNYRFTGSNNEVLKYINIAQRQHLAIDQNWTNSVGLFRDSDTLASATHGDGFTGKYNPLMGEWYDPIIRGGQDAKRWDNIHQTYKGMIEEPGIGIQDEFPYFHARRSGCPECNHSHWRWGRIVNLPLLDPEGAGNLIGIPAGSKQDVDLAVVAYQPGEEDPPFPFNDLLYGLVQYWQPV
jgi:hypothetical protein